MSIILICKGEDVLLGNNYFTDEQVKELNNNPYVKKATQKSINYSKEFKEIFWERYSQGESPSEILVDLGIDPKMLGIRRVSNIVQRIKMEAERLEGFDDTRSKNSGRPKTSDMPIEDKVAYLEHKIAYLKQENEFLKKINFANRRAKWQHQKKNSK